MTEEELRAEKERLIKDDLASIGNKMRHAFNQGYELGRKAVKTTRKDDLISRSAAIDLGRIIYDDDGIGALYIRAHDLWSLPSVVEKTGRWKKTQMLCGETSYQCTECEWYCGSRANYCPWCGAKMEDGDMNQEMAMFKEEIKDIQELQAKARKYDEMKEAVAKAKEEIKKAIDIIDKYKDGE